MSAKWFFKMEWCKKQSVSPANAYFWKQAEEAYTELTPYMPCTVITRNLWALDPETYNVQPAPSQSPENG